MQETAKVNYVQYSKGSKKKKGRSRPSGGSGGSSSSGGNTTNDGKPSNSKGNGRKPPLATDICWRCGKSQHQKGQPCKAGSSLQKLWNQRTLWEGVYEEVNPLGRSSKQFQWFWSRLLWWIWWTCLCSDTSSSHKGDTQEETSHPVSNKCQLRESEEASRRPLSYCSAEGWHRSWCQSSKLHYIWQNNRQQIDPTAINLQNGSIWKFHCRCTWEVLHIPQMERQDLQAIILHDNSQCITLNLLSRDGCYTLGVLKPCYSVETLKTSKSSSTQPTTDLEQHQMHGRSFQHWSDEGTGLEKQSHSHSAVSPQGSTSRHLIEETEHP